MRQMLAVALLAAHGHASLASAGAPSPAAHDPESLAAASRRFFDGARATGTAEESPLSSFAARARAALSAAGGEISLDTGRGRPAFIRFTDLDGDGVPELIASQFAGSGPLGSGRVDVYRMRRPGDLTSFERETAMDGVRFPNEVSPEDVDGDGDLDLVIPSGFLACVLSPCGGLAWAERTRGGWTVHRLVKGDRFFYHKVLRADFDGDGVKDWLTVGERKGRKDAGESRVVLFKGRPGGSIETPGRILSPGLGSLPIALDMDGDGDLDLASAEYFGTQDSFVWLENAGGGRWERRVIDGGSGPSIQLSAIPNLFGDGRTILVGSNHVNQCDAPSGPESAVFAFEPSGDLNGSWRRRPLSEGIRSACSRAPGVQGAPGVFAWGDADGDGDLDIAVHGDGDARVYLLEQTAPGRFETRVLRENVPQGGVSMADLDGDGAAEIAVSSYTNDKLLIIRGTRR